MLLFFGAYQRDRALPGTTEICPYCRNLVPVEWRRLYRTAHLVFFPLFSWGARTIAGCRMCGYRASAVHPSVPATLPFLDRLGFTIPLVGVLSLAVFFLGFALAAPRTPRIETSVRERLDHQLARAGGPAYGAGEGAASLAEAARDAIATETAITNCAADATARRTPGSGRAIVLFCQHTELRKLDAAARHALVAKIQTATVPLLGDDDHLVVAVKGNFMYGVLARGEGASWTVTHDDDVLPPEIDAAVVAANTADRFASLD